MMKIALKFDSLGELRKGDNTMFLFFSGLTKKKRKKN